MVAIIAIVIIIQALTIIANTIMAIGLKEATNFINKTIIVKLEYTFYILVDKRSGNFKNND